MGTTSAQMLSVNYKAGSEANVHHRETGGQWEWVMVENDFYAPKPLLTELPSQHFFKCDWKLFALYY